MKKLNKDIDRNSSFDRSVKPKLKYNPPLLSIFDINSDTAKAFPWPTELQSQGGVEIGNNS